MTPPQKNFRIGVYAILRMGEQYIFGKKNRGPFFGKYDLIGGGMEHGETPSETLMREVREETGIELSSSGKLFDVYSHVVTFEKVGHEISQHMLGIVSLVSLPSTVRISGGDDSAEILFASRDTVLSLELTPIARMAMEAFFSDQRLV